MTELILISAVLLIIVINIVWYSTTTKHETTIQKTLPMGAFQIVADM
jgi:hypothetical protein